MYTKTCNLYTNIYTIIYNIYIQNTRRRPGGGGGGGGGPARPRGARAGSCISCTYLYIFVYISIYSDILEYILLYFAIYFVYFCIFSIKNALVGYKGFAVGKVDESYVMLPIQAFPMGLGADRKLAKKI